MKKYYTQVFTRPEDIDVWLNSFEEKREGRPMSVYSFAVVGYVSVDNKINITVETQTYTL